MVLPLIGCQDIEKYMQEEQNKHFEYLDEKDIQILILKELVKLMSGVDDLNTAVTNLTTAVNTEITAVNAVIAALQAGGITDSQAEVLAQTLQSSITNLNNEVSGLPQAGSSTAGAVAKPTS